MNTQEPNDNHGGAFSGFFRGLFKYLRIIFVSCFRVLRALFKGLFIVCVVALIGVIFFGVFKAYPIYLDYKDQVKDVVANSTEADFRLQESSFIYNSQGEIIAKLTKDEDSVYLKYADIPENAVEAFIAIEDRNFWENSGIDIKGIFRVALNYFKTDGEEMHGASTITQQLARNRFLTREVSFERKAKEMLIAMDLTEKYTKEQIMEFYINDINFANTYYGLEAAAKGYFGKAASELSLSQTAYLCAIPNSPTFYNPYNHPENALKRRDKILKDMKEIGFITEFQYDDAIREEITVQRTSYGFYNYETTYAIDSAVSYLMKLDGFPFQYGFETNDEYRAYQQSYNDAYAKAKDDLYTGGYRIYTSLDPAKQDILQTSIDSVLTFDEALSKDGIYELQGAATTIDNRNGKVVAIVGGRSQESSVYNLNRAFQSFRQPGSTIKPLIIYTPALEIGYTPNTKVKNISIDEAKEDDANLKGLQGKEMTLREGVERSRNGVAWSVYADVGTKLGMSHLLKMQFDNIVPDDFYMAASLGGFTYGATTEEMAGAYAALANEGAFITPTCLMKMIDKEGIDIFVDYGEVQVYDSESANIMVDILKGVVTRGTAAAMRWQSDIEAAGKTGTTNKSKDGWFCGMTPYYTTAVWVGYDQPKQLSDLYGATYPASIWKQSMEQFVVGLEPAAFTPPGDIPVQEGVYLAGRDDSEVLIGNYTVGDYRLDHAKAEEARGYIKQMRGSGSTKKAYLRQQIENLVGTISDSVLRDQLLGEMDNPAYVGSAVPPPTLPVELPAETQAPAVEETPPDPGLGPGANLSQPKGEEPPGPGAELGS